MQIQQLPNIDLTSLKAIYSSHGILNNIIFYANTVSRSTQAYHFIRSKQSGNPKSKEQKKLN